MENASLKYALSMFFPIVVAFVATAFIHSETSLAMVTANVNVAEDVLEDDTERQNYKLICKTEKVTGSNRREKHCRTVKLKPRKVNKTGVMCKYERVTGSKIKKKICYETR